MNPKNSKYVVVWCRESYTTNAVYAIKMPYLLLRIRVRDEGGGFEMKQSISEP